jgi:pyruvate/2-oxoglutarate dehydrogenase complex dihydrolipoamide dehydrogenase (E3) component
MALEQYTNLVIGTGEAGKYTAWHRAKLGERTAIVERALLGGACPNVACLPTKNVIHSARVASLARRGAEFGLATGSVRVEMSGVKRRKTQMVDGLIQIHRNRFAESGAEVIMGEARFVEPRTVQIALSAGGERSIRAERVFVAVGTRAHLPDVPGLAASAPLTHVEALDLERLPEHLAVLGGGYVGLEFAQALRRFGSRVTVVQRGEHLLEREDPDVSGAIEQLMRDEGIEVLLGSAVVGVTGRSGAGLALQVRSGGSTRTVEASDLLVATGRVPNTDRLGADRGGIELDARGYVRVNEKLETTSPGVWALGECAGSPQFTHVSYDDYRIVRDNLAGSTRTTRNRLVPYCLFTDPELAHVGLTESEAKARGASYRLFQMPTAAILRTHTLSEMRGFVKALVGADDRVLGFTAFGAEASELLAAVQTAMIAGLPYQALRDAVFAHPTTAEGLTVLFAKPPVTGG